MRDLPSRDDKRLQWLDENVEAVTPHPSDLAKVIQEIIGYLEDREAYGQESARAMGY